MLIKPRKRSLKVSTLPTSRLFEQLQVDTVLGIDGLEATVLLAAERGIDLELFEQSRGWERRHLEAALSRLGQHGLVDSEGGLTDEGRSLRAEIEDLTDRQAFGVLARLGEAHELVLGHLESGAEMIRAAGAIPYPNPIGLDPR